MLPVGLLLQGESAERGSEVVIEDFEPEAFKDSFEDPKVPEKAGLPPLAMGGVTVVGQGD